MRQTTSYDFLADAAWDHIPCAEAVLSAAARADAACFGSLAQRGAVSRASIRQVLAAMPASAWRFCDINLRGDFYDDSLIRESLALANALKCNEDELPIIAAACDCAVGEDVEAQLAALADTCDLRCIALTCGPEGSWLRDAAGACHFSPPAPAEVVDTVGAGDSFSANLLAGLLAEADPAEINTTGNRIAAWVCSQAGATPRLPADLVPAYASDG